MPSRPLRQCPTPGCRRLDRHRHGENRPSAAKRQYDRRHRRWRLLILHRDPICRRCNDEPSTEADHIIPLEHGGDWSLENGQGLGKSCHSKKTAEDRKKYR